MSKYTTELRFICETLAGLTESVGLNDVDYVIEQCREKIFDFDYPIWDATYKPVLEKKILSHFYTREIGYETYGRWKLALRNKLNEIMPYYNELYKKSAQFGKVNIFDDVAYNISRSVSEAITKAERENLSKQKSDFESSKTDVNKNNTSQSTKTTSGEDIKKYNNDKEYNRNESGSDNKTGNSNTAVEQTTDRTKEISENESETFSRNKTDNSKDDSTLNTSENSTSNASSQVSGVSHESGNSKNNTATNSDNVNNSVNRQLYSDTTGGALDFGNLNDNTGGSENDPVSNTYITNLTKNIKEDSSNQSSNTNGSTESSIEKNDNENSNRNEKIENNSQSVGIATRSGEENEEGENTKDKTNNETEKNTGLTIGNENNTESGNYNKNEQTIEINSGGVNSTNTSESIDEENGSSTENHSYVKESNNGEHSNKDVNGNMNSTEDFVESVIGKRGNKTYSAMFEEFLRALKNIDVMVIEELNTLFFGLWE